MALRRVHSAVVYNTLARLTYPSSQLPVTSLRPLPPGNCGRGLSLCRACWLHMSSSLDAGHSKWQNIQHIKAAGDKLKNRNSALLVQKIGACLNKNPSLDLKLNNQLAALQKWARSLNIPNETFNRQIERARQLKDPKNIVTLDGQGLQGTGIIIECFTVNKKHTENILQSALKKGGFSIYMDGMDMFHHRGLVDVVLPEVDLPSAQSDPENFNLDKYIDIAIEAEAEEVTLEPGEEKPYLCFTCGPFDLPKVQRALEEVGLEVTSAERTYTPKETVTITKDHWELVEKMINRMDEVPEIVKYHFNFVVEGDESS